ncbi:MAG: 3-oxoacyl-[acyl-carrier-protein] synthase III C-terminal domain-containing protein [Bacteroidota bacterium]
MKINILSIEKHLSENKISSETLDILANGTKGRIEKNTGVKFRHRFSESATVAEIGSIVLKKALAKANLHPSDIDLLIFAGASYDYPVPHNSVIIKSKITDDSVNFACMDIDTTCLSFLNALDVAHLYLQAGRYKRIAIVSVEISSKTLKPHDEKVFGLFGDASVAMIIEASITKGYSCSYVDFENYPSGALLAHIPIGGLVNQGIYASPSDIGYCFKMDGKKLIRLTLEHLDPFVDKIEQQTKTKLIDFDFILTHQTSKFGNEYFLKTFNLNKEKVIETLSVYGNCISVSIPLGLEKLLENNTNITNKKVLILGTAAGLSLGAMVLEFE